MKNTAEISVDDNDLLGSLRGFFVSVLELEDIAAILVPLGHSRKNLVSPTLVTNPERLVTADPLSPYFPINSAKIVSRLTKKALGAKIAVVMRPCEIRAFIELVKLNQGRMDEIVILGMDCLGAFRNDDFLKVAGNEGDRFTNKFYNSVLQNKEYQENEFKLSPGCNICENPVPLGADLMIETLGIDVTKVFLVKARTGKGENLLKTLSLKEAEEPSSRKEAVENLVKQRIQNKEEMFAKTSDGVNSLEKLEEYLSGCINCYNCRVACPVCYCRECVFVTNQFDHDPFQYLGWARRKGAVKMPTDTVFYHMTRLAHMSLSCVGCGQCSNACPNDISLVELFTFMGDKTQKAFEYKAGGDLKEKPPLSLFHEDEFPEVVGFGSED